MSKWTLDGASSATRLIQGAMNAAARATGSPKVTEVGDRDWRQNYPTSFHNLTALEGEDSPTMAKAALDFIYANAQLPDGTNLAEAKPIATEVPVSQVGKADQAATCPVPRLSLPIGHSLLNKRAQAALSIVSLHPQWWNLAGYEVVVLAGAAQLAPTVALAHAGATVHAIVRADSKRRKALLQACQDAPGKLVIPSGRICDVVKNPRQLAGYICGISKPVILVDALYAPSRAHVHAAIAADLVERMVCQARPDTTVCFSGTPTDVYYSKGHLVDAIVPLQGPNYLAAKRIGRWRASTLTGQGVSTITPILPLAATESVMNSDKLISTLVCAPAVGVYPVAPSVAARLAASWLIFEMHSSDEPAPWQGVKAPCGLWGNPDSQLNSLLPNANMRLHAAWVAGRLGAGRDAWVGQVPDSIFSEGGKRLRVLARKMRERLGR